MTFPLEWSDTWWWLAGCQLALVVKLFMPSKVTLHDDWQVINLLKVSSGLSNLWLSSSGSHGGWRVIWKWILWRQICFHWIFFPQNLFISQNFFPQITLEFLHRNLFYRRVNCVWRVLANDRVILLTLYTVSVLSMIQWIVHVRKIWMYYDPWGI